MNVLLTPCVKKVFAPCKAEPDVWMCPNKDKTKYEYIAVYVDDLALAMEDPGGFVELLRSKHGYKLKGVGPISYHLGCVITGMLMGPLSNNQRNMLRK